MQINLENWLPDCCSSGVVSIEKVGADEASSSTALLPTVKTIIVIGHHITHSLEWVWFKFPTERIGETCPADLHAKSVAERVCNGLEKVLAAIKLEPDGGNEVIQ